MQYGVISNYDKDNKMCNFCIISDDGNYNIIGYKICSEEEVVLASRNLGLKLLNFSIDRDGSIKQDCGSFSRFNPKGVFVVIAEIKSHSGKTLGYRLINSVNNAVVNKRTSELVSMEKSAGRPIIQNAIIRRNTVCCYPLHSFPELIIARNNKRPNKKNVQSERKSKDNVQSTKPTKNIDVYTEGQKKEISACRKHGINSNFIENPNLTHNQMRILWVAKSKGVFAEEFADPKYNTDVMKFYADRLFSQEAVDNCRPLLQHPELSVDELEELYECLIEGVDFEDLIGKTPNEISVERLNRGLKWDEEKEIPKQVFEDEILTKAIAYARKVRGY